MNDYARLRAALNLSAPASNATIAEIDAYTQRVALVQGSGEPKPTGVTPAIQGDAAESKAELGFTIANLDQDVQAGEPPHLFVALRGRFDPKQIDQAVRGDSKFKDQLILGSYQATTYYTWGEDDKVDPRRRTSVRPLGQSSRLAVVGPYLYWTHWTDGLRDMIDAGQNKTRSLADNADVKLIAGGLARFDLYAVWLTNKGVTIDPASILLPNASPAAARAALDAQQKEALRPYQALAVGVGQDAQGPFNVLVLLHPDARTAGENVARLKANVETGKSLFSGKAWSEQIEKSEISSDGRLVVAKLRTQNRTLLADVLSRRDSLLVHE